MTSIIISSSSAAATAATAALVMWSYTFIPAGSDYGVNTAKPFYPFKVLVTGLIAEAKPCQIRPCTKAFQRMNGIMCRRV